MRRVLIAIIVAVACVVCSTSTAQAYPYQQGDYGSYAWEGYYPTVSGCAGTFYQPSNVPGGATKYAWWGGYYVKLQFFYSSKCGAFARISNAPSNCQADILRDANHDGNDEGRMWETVDPGINYAYTKMANNLNGRWARAQLECWTGSTIYLVAMTNWY